MTAKKYSYKLAIAANQNIKERDFWLKQLAGEPKKSVFPYDFRGQAGKGYVPGKETLTLGGELFSRLMKVSNETDVKLHMILLTVLAALLEKYTGSHDILLGTPIYKQAEHLEFINTMLVLRNRVNGQMGFKELLLQVRGRLREAAEHQNYPLEVLIDQLGWPGIGEEFPLFDVVLMLDNIHDRSYIKGVDYSMLFSFSRKDGSVEGAVEYNPLLYRKTTVERVIRHFIRLLQRALFDADVTLAAIDILTEEEKAQILNDFNNREFNYPRQKTVVDMFAEQVKENPDGCACFEGGTFYTYLDLDRRSNLLAKKIEEM
jgi:non-ribosomal peptide synthetase component F